MKSRRLGRLCELAATLERVQRFAVLRASADEDAARRGCADTEVAHMARRSEGNTCLENGDTSGWRASEIAVQREKQLHSRWVELRMKELAKLETAQKAHAERRQTTEQMKILVAKARDIENAEFERRTQAALDDRFVARWVLLQSSR